MGDTFKETVVNAVKRNLAQIPFLTLDEYKDTLFDHEPDQNSITPQIEFLKDTPLSELAFEKHASNSQVFLMRKKGTNQSISVSNRIPSCRELRSWVLQDHLLQDNFLPTQTVYDAISELIQSERSSDVVQSLKACLVGEKAKIHHEGKCMSEKHFDFFISVILNQLKEKCNDASFATPASDMRSKLEYARKHPEEIWKGIPVSEIYDITWRLCHENTIEYNLIQMDRKAKALNDTDVGQPAQIARKRILLKKLVQQFKTGKINYYEFSESYDKSIKKWLGYTAPDRSAQIESFDSALSAMREHAKTQAINSELYNNLDTALKNQKELFLDGTISGDIFAIRCKQHIQTARQNEPIGFFDKVLHYLSLILHTISCGLIPLKQSGAKRRFFKLEESLNPLNPPENNLRPELLHPNLSQK